MQMLEYVDSTERSFPKLLAFLVFSELNMAIFLIPATIILEAYDFLLYDLIPYSFSNICVLLIN